MQRSSGKPNTKRLRAEQAGRLAEVLAALWFQLRFYRILRRRYRSPVGEIDLVLRRGRTVVFVEVKARGRASSEEDALRSVNQGRIVRAANHFLMRHPELSGYDMRFDVIFLAPGQWPRHIHNAFGLTG